MGNETPLNVRRLVEIKNIYKTVLSILDDVEELEDKGTITGSKAFFGEEAPGPEIGDNGDWFLYEEGDNQFLYTKRNGVWIFIGKGQTEEETSPIFGLVNMLAKGTTVSSGTATIASPEEPLDEVLLQVSGTTTSSGDTTHITS